MPPGRATIFRVPADIARRFDSVRLHAAPSGSADDVTTSPLDVRRGRRIEWRLKKVLASSRARVM